MNQRARREKNAFIMDSHVASTSPEPKNIRRVGLVASSHSDKLEPQAPSLTVTQRRDSYGLGYAFLLLS